MGQAHITGDLVVAPHWERQSGWRPNCVLRSVRLQDRKAQGAQITFRVASHRLAWKVCIYWTFSCHFVVILPAWRSEVADVTMRWLGAFLSGLEAQ